jgi:hypothetical protein
MRQRRRLGSRHGAEGGASGSPSVCKGDLRRDDTTGRTGIGQTRLHQ